MTEPALNPCQVCGCDDFTIDDASWRDSFGKHWIQCPACDFRGAKCDTEAEAIAAWNNRAEPDKLPEWAKEKINDRISHLRNLLNNDQADAVAESCKREIIHLNWILSLTRD